MRYVVADPCANSGWSHIWLEHSDSLGPTEVERLCRFVFGCEKNGVAG